LEAPKPFVFSISFFSKPIKLQTLGMTNRRGLLQREDLC
jgi:hypothetical protein